MLRVNPIACVAVAAFTFHSFNAYAQNTTAEARENEPANSATQSALGTEQSIPVQTALVMKMRKSNNAQIELAKIAQQKSQDTEVKAIAEHVQHDHTLMNQNLEKIAAHGKSHQSADRQQGRDSQLERVTNDALRSNKAGPYSATVDPLYCKISDQACDNVLAMTKEMLKKQEGQNFDMAFLSQQCVALTTNLGELKAIEELGPEPLKKAAKDSAIVVKEHLAAMKLLAKKLEDDRKAPDSSRQ